MLSEMLVVSSTTTAQVTSAPSSVLGKRGLDLCVAIVALVALCPLFAIVAFAIKLDSKGPVFYRQMRVGRNRKLFMMYKFRTMRVGTPELPTDQIASVPDPITRVGRFFRRTSIDELPQLINVFRGEMSLVGPRPVLFNHESIISLRDEAGLHLCKPGITGLAQINGRDDLSDVDKVKFDRIYMENLSLNLDLKILLKTIGVVIGRKGAN